MRWDISGSLSVDGEQGTMGCGDDDVLVCLRSLSFAECWWWQGRQRMTSQSKSDLPECGTRICFVAVTGTTHPSPPLHNQSVKSPGIHQTACLGLPQWCDQQLRKPRSILFFVASIHLFATLGKQVHFGLHFAGRTASVLRTPQLHGRVTHIASVMLRTQVPRHSTPDT